MYKERSFTTLPNHQGQYDEVISDVVLQKNARIATFPVKWSSFGHFCEKPCLTYSQLPVWEIVTYFWPECKVVNDHLLCM